MTLTKISKNLKESEIISKIPIVDDAIPITKVFFLNINVAFFVQNS